jgi:hypothetical protein
MTTIIGLIFFFSAIVLSISLFQYILKAGAVLIAAAMMNEAHKDVERQTRIGLTLIVAFLWTLVFYWYN